MSPAYLEMPAPLLVNSSMASTSALHVVSSPVHMPSTPLLLGLIGALIAVLTIIGLCAYLFRGRLRIPDVLVEAKNADKFDAGAAEAQIDSAQSGDPNPKTSTQQAHPSLRPLFLGTGRAMPIKPSFKPLLLPKRQSIIQQSSDAKGLGENTIGRRASLPAARKRGSFPFGKDRHSSVLHNQTNSAAPSIVIQASRSFPTDICKVMLAADCPTPTSPLKAAEGPSKIEQQPQGLAKNPTEIKEVS